MTSTSIALTITNATAGYFNWSATRIEGEPLEPAVGSLAPGASHALSAETFEGDTGGSVSLRHNAQMTMGRLSYEASVNPALSSLTAGFEADWYVSGTQPAAGTSDIVASTRVYPAISTPWGGKILSLGEDPMKLAALSPLVFRDFVENMFDEGVRSEAAITAALDGITDSWPEGEAPPVFYADFTAGQIPAMVAMWKTYWLKGDAASCPAADAVLIDFLKDFIAATRQHLWLPKINVETLGPPAVFNLTGYVEIRFFDPGTDDWAEATVERFLTLLVSGAHFVQICAREDMKTLGKSYKASRNLYAAFKAAPLTRGNDLGNSHYVDQTKTALGYPVHVNTSGWYFLDINGQTMPDTVDAAPDKQGLAPGLLNAFLVGVTHLEDLGRVQGGEYNAFFQHEGWQAEGAGGYRHMLDFDASNTLRWNISTFGASPYSEKRGTSVFLAPGGWEPVVTKVTRMMPYYGAYAMHSGWFGKVPQPWLDTAVVKIDEDKATPLDGDYVMPRWS